MFYLLEKYLIFGSLPFIMIELKTPPKEIIIGLITGVASGLVVVLGQFIAELSGNKYDMPTIILTAFFALILILLVMTKIKIRRKKR